MFRNKQKQLVTNVNHALGWMPAEAAEVVDLEHRGPQGRPAEELFMARDDHVHLGLNGLVRLDELASDQPADKIPVLSCFLAAVALEGHK